MIHLPKKTRVRHGEADRRRHAVPMPVWTEQVLLDHFGFGVRKTEKCVHQLREASPGDAHKDHIRRVISPSLAMLISCIPVFFGQKIIFLVLHGPSKFHNKKGKNYSSSPDLNLSTSHYIYIFNINFTGANINN